MGCGSSQSERVLYQETLVEQATILTKQSARAEMGCGSSQSARVFYQETLMEQVTVSTICDKAEPEGEAGTDKTTTETTERSKTAYKLSTTVPVKGDKKAKSAVKPMPYVPVDDYDVADISISDASDITRMDASNRR